MKNIFYSLSLLVFTACSSSEFSITESVVKEFHQKCQVKLLVQGRQALKYRIQLLRSAKKSIDLQTFIWTDDECGRILMHECMMAAKRGVQVRLLCDHLFSNQNPRILAAISKTVNLHIKIYNPATETLKPAAFGKLISACIINCYLSMVKLPFAVAEISKIPTMIIRRK